MLDFVTTLRSYYQKRPLHRRAQICGCCMLVGLIGADGNCGRKQQALVKTSMPVSIKACVPRTEPIITDPTQSVVWSSADRNDYKITFNKKFAQLPTGPTDITPSDPPVLHPGGTTNFDTSHTYTGCLDPVLGTTVTGCYFKYNIYYVHHGVPDRIPCRDPGVHVIPTGVLSASQSMTLRNQLREPALAP